MQNNTIDPIPRLPQEIVDAINNENLVVFIGAGVSRLIGCKGWDELARNLVNRCFSTKKTDGSTCINFKEKDTLFQINDHKKVITICHNILRQNGLVDVFFEELDKSFKEDEDLLKSQNIYDELYGLRGIFITTNADQHFDSKFNPQQIVYKIEDFKPSNIDRTKLYHIHGSILDKNSLIFTLPQYIQRYNDRQFKAFLNEIFNKYTVLFVGYGMAEFELLDFLITKFDSNKGTELKHFILQPFYKGENNILKFEQDYYEKMGISVLGYEKDERGYNQLYVVIKSWNTEINQTSTYLYDAYQEIEYLANNYEKEKADRVFQIIKNDKPLENYFFKKLASSSNPFPWLEPLKVKGFFNPINNPTPMEVPDKKGYFTIPQWNVLGYIENVAAQNSKKPSNIITELLLDIINSISNYRNKTGDRIDNYGTDWAVVKIIFTLPLEKISKEHIEFIGTSLKSKLDTTLVAAEIGKTVLPKLINNKAKELVLELMQVVFDYKKNDKVISDKYTSVMDEYWLNEALKTHKSAIAKLCGIEAAEIALNKMHAITTEDKSQFNNIWIPTIEDHPQTHFTDRYECQLVHFVRDIFEFSKPIQIKMKISDLIKEEHPLFKRIALHSINHHYKDLNELFWNWEGNPFGETHLKHELYELLKSNCSSFTQKQIEKILDWIESNDYYVPTEIKDDNKRIEKLLAYRKKEWLSALLETNNLDVISSYEKYQKINPAERDHPGFDYWSDSGVGYVSPIKKIELINKSNEEIANYLTTFKEEKGWNSPSIEGLSESLRDCVLENPEKFANTMKPFLNVQRVYQHALLGGLSEAWRAKKDFDWDGILNFMSQLIESDEFWRENYENENWNYRNWIISQIANLIEEGTKDDNHAFDAKLLPHAENILLILAEKTESNLSEMNDLVTSVLNSSKGKIFSAMVNYSLRSARIHKKTQDDRWVKSIKDNFNKRLDRDIETSLEFSVTLGKYLPNFFYLDKNWVIDNINRIFPRDNDTHWNAVFTSYLFYSSKVYKDLYFLIRENGHYAKALQTDFGDKHTTDRLVQHICIGYLEDWEKLEDNNSLIFKLLRNGNLNQLSAIISFFWMLRDKLTEKIKGKVKPIWKVLFELLLKNEEKPEYQKIFSNLSEWLSLIDEIDDQAFEWLKRSAKYIQGFNVYLFIEYLLKNAPKTPAKVGEIYLQMLCSGVYPTFKKENIEGIVQILYDQGQKDIADRICTIYLAKGFDFLGTIYEEHRNPKS